MGQPSYRDRELASMGNRVAIPVRMSAADRERIRKAAKARRMSMSAFVLDSALRAVGHRRVWGQEAKDAIAALVGLGYAEGDAENAVGQALEAQPAAGADEIVQVVMKAKGAGQ